MIILELLLDSPARIKLKQGLKVLVVNYQINIIHDRKLSETPKTLEELSQEYNISRERIRQIEERAFQKLQSEMMSLARDTRLIQA